MSQSPTRNEPTETEHRGLPMVLPEAGELHEGWLARIMRILFGWKAAATRADLEMVLTAEQPESGFSPTEAAMLKNILGLRDCRIESVMVPRADIVAVQQDITIGELAMVFAGAGHSRLVVYNDTLDDPTGMVHIRDLVAFMVARAADRPGRRQRARTAAAGRPRPRQYRSFDAVDGRQDRPRNPLRAALDAGARSARQDAGDAYSPRTGDRRIRRQRRAGVDRGSGRAHRRRYRRRT